MYHFTKSSEEDFAILLLKVQQSEILIIYSVFSINSNYIYIYIYFFFREEVTMKFIFLSFDLLFYFFSPIVFISWRLITSQYCSGFCHTLT